MARKIDIMQGRFEQGFRKLSERRSVLVEFGDPSKDEALEPRLFIRCDPECEISKGVKFLGFDLRLPEVAALCDFCNELLSEED